MNRSLLALSLSILVFAAPVHAADKWLSVRSKNFFLVGNASEGAMKRVGRNLEEFRAAFNILIPGVSERDSVPTTVVVFKDDASFRPYKPLYNGKPANAAGFFQSGSDLNFIALTGNNPTPHVIYHEYVHSLTRDGSSPLPPWASEGLAEFYSTLETQAGGKEALIGKVVPQHVLTLNDDSLMPLDAFFSVEHDSPFYNEAEKQGIFHAQAWAFVHYMVLGNGQRQNQMSTYLNLLASGKSAEDSFRQAFQTDYATLEKELRNYMQARVAWPAVRVKLDDKLDFEREMQVTSISEARPQFYLGDLLLHSDRLEEAEAHLQKAMTLDSSFPGSYASMGLLRVGQQRHDDALKFLTRAVESDSQNYIAHYRYAMLLQDQADDRDDEARNERMRVMRTHLKRSIELAARYTEAYRLLGYVSLVLRDELAETEELLKKAIAFAPGRQELSIDLAQVMMANGQALAARAILTPLKNSADPRTRDHAQNLLDNIAGRLENEQAIREYEQRRQAFNLVDVADDADDNTDPDDGPPVLERRDSERPSVARPTTTPRPQGPQIEGLLTLIDCSRGATLRIQIGNGNIQLHANDPSEIEFTSSITSIKDSIACGPVSPGVPVVVTYRRTNDPQYLGVPIRVMFVEEN